MLSPSVNEKLVTCGRMLTSVRLFANGAAVVNCPVALDPAGKFAHGPVPHGAVKFVKFVQLPTVYLYATSSGAVATRPIRLPGDSVTHRLPSGPTVMPTGCAWALMPLLYSVTTPAVVIFPIR